MAFWGPLAPLGGPRPPLGASGPFTGPRICPDMWEIILRFHSHLYLWNWTQLCQDMGLCTQEYSVHPCAWVMLCAHICLACFPDSIDTLISLIWPNFTEIWACAHKHKVCMHASLHAWVILSAQTDPMCSPDSIDTLISLIQHNLAEIWA